MKITGLDVSVEYVKEDLGGAMGLYNMHTSMIKVNAGLPKHTKYECTLHEVLECVVNTHEIKMDHADLTTLSMVLYQVFRDNGGKISKWK